MSDEQLTVLEENQGNYTGVTYCLLLIATIIVMETLRLLDRQRREETDFTHHSLFTVFGSFTA